MRRLPVDKVEVRMRVDCLTDEEPVVYVEVDFDGHRKALTRNAAHELIAGVRRQLDNVDRFDAAADARKAAAST